jgi:predicted DNA-binding transcriptional regulator AlpA
MDKFIFHQTSLDELTEKTANSVVLKLKDLLPQTHEKQDQLLTRRKTAETLQISLVTLDEYCKKGIIPSYRIGKNIRFKQSEIQGIINEGMRFKFKKGGK